MKYFDELIKDSHLTRERVEELTDISVDEHTADKCLILIAEILDAMETVDKGKCTVYRGT